MLRMISFLFVSVCVRTLASVPHISARIVGSPLSTSNVRLRDQSCQSLLSVLNLRGGSNADTSSMSDSSYDESEVRQPSLKSLASR